MIEYKIYQGQLSDKELGEVLDKLLQNKREEKIYLDWNGFILSIYPSSTKQELLKEYHEEIAKQGVWEGFKRKEYISIEELSKKIINALLKLGE